MNGVEKQDKRKSSLLDGWNAPPNLVTFSRIILVIVFLVLYVKAGAWGVDNVAMRWAAAVIFIIAACTDKLDGWMARKYNQVTELGKLMDPIADKLLICGTLIVAAAFNEFGNQILGWVVTALFLIREIGITVMRFFVIDTGGKVIAASQAGKYKTLAQCIGLAMLMLPMWKLAGDSLQPTPLWMTVYYTITYALIYLALILCLYSGGEYLVNTFGGRKKESK